MSEVHITYDPLTTAPSVFGIAQSYGLVPISTINEPDDKAGSNTTSVSNQSTRLTVTAGAIHGRFDQFNVINNPG